MLSDPREIEIISKARQKNVRDPRRSRKHFENIFSDFMQNVDFSERSFLDMGPGQFDFGVMARERGGETIAIDNDPAVVELGRHKGFECHEGDLRNLSRSAIKGPLDGVFCKFSISAFWFDSAASQTSLVGAITDRLAPDGWLWIAPWNGGHSDLPDSLVDEILTWQIEAFAQAGFEVWELSRAATVRYGVHGVVANNVLFTRNLEVPSDTALVRPLLSETPRGAAIPWDDAKETLSSSTSKKQVSDSYSSDEGLTAFLMKWSEKWFKRLLWNS